MNKRDFLAAASLAGILPATTASAAGKGTAGPALLTVTGAVTRSNRGPLDPALDQMMVKHGVQFTKAFEFDSAALRRLPSVTIRPTLEYDEKPHALSGPLLETVLQAAGVSPDAAVQVALRAVDGYNVALRLADARRYRMIVATAIDGRPLGIGGLGPQWAVYDADRVAEFKDKPVKERFGCALGGCITWKSRLRSSGHELRSRRQTRERGGLDDRCVRAAQVAMPCSNARRRRGARPTRSRQQRRMPTLNWIGKDAVIRHHKEVPFRLLEPVPELSCGDAAGSGNLIVQGDNLHALKALLPRYAGQVKCIYIDPPYNTGNEGWAYNDNVNSTEIRSWLGEVVGKEGETLDRHDRWLCMMYPRLVLLRQFLREDGAIFISIDDNEVASLRLLMDEVFGARNFVATAVWEKMDSPKNTAVHLSEDHEYVVIYARAAERWRPHRVPRTAEMIGRYKNPDNDPRGPWLLSDLAARNLYAAGRYPITTPSGKVIDGPPAGSYWRVSEDKFKELDRDNRVWWGKSGSNRPGTKRFLSEVREGVVPQTLWPWKEVGSTRHSKQELSEIIASGASQDLFITPKPSTLIERILQIATDKGSLVLDSFAGSGTTGHSVLKQNIADGGTRRFILVEMDPTIARNVTAERVRRVARGYTSAKGKAVEGLGGGFQFCRLSAEPLFDATGQVRADVRFAQLADFVWFAETGGGYTGRADSPLVGEHEGRAIYLLYNGILKDRSMGGGNVLTASVLDALPRHDGPKVIFAAACRLGAARLAREGIVFRQTPYALEV